MLRVSVNGSSGAADHGFSSTPHSIARPHMFSSIEYSFSFDAEIGISHLSASSMQSARVRPHTRTGAITSRSGARIARRHLEAHLVVALAGAAVPDRVGAVAAGRRDEVLDDHRTRQRGDERVLALVQRVGAQRGDEEVARVLLARVDDLGLDRARGRGPFADHVLLAGRELADVDRARDHLDAPLLAHPADGDRGVETSRIREHDSLRHDAFSL